MHIIYLIVPAAVVFIWLGILTPTLHYLVEDATKGFLSHPKMKSFAPNLWFYSFIIIMAVGLLMIGFADQLGRIHPMLPAIGVGMFVPAIPAMLWGMIFMGPPWFSIGPPCL